MYGGLVQIFGFKSFNFNIFFKYFFFFFFFFGGGGGGEMGSECGSYLLGLKILWIFFGGHNKNELFGGSFL